MIRRWIISGSAVVLAALAGMPQEAEAQPYCPATYCVPCAGTGFYQGIGDYPDLNYWQTICSSGDCSPCGAKLAEDVPVVVDITTRLEGASSAGAFQEIAALYGDRLAVDTSRGMVVVQGGCTGEAMVSLVFLEHHHARVLARNGVRSVEALIQEAASPERPPSE